MTVGTKSLLFGVHAFWLHPFFVLWAWIKLHGFPFDPRIWVAILVHDWGYWGCENMDGVDGKQHPRLGGKIMGTLFGPRWGRFTQYHSRSLARLDGEPESRLCAPDKLASALMPMWLFILMSHWTGEIYEYMNEAVNARHRGVPINQDLYTGGFTRDRKLWLKGLRQHIYERELNRKLVV